MNNRLVLLAVTIAGTLGLAAWAGAAPAQKASASAAPIPLMVTGPVSSPEFSLPSIPAGAQIAVNEVNSAYSVYHHRFRLIVCNDQNSPNIATQCARQAIQSHVAAMVGSLEDYDLEVEPLLQGASIPWVGLTTSDDYTTPNLFLFGGQGADGFAATGMALAQRGCKRIADVVSASAGTQNVNAEDIAAGIRAGGAKVAGTYIVPGTVVDLAPTVAALRSARADCVASGLSPSQSGPLISALASGPKLKLAVVSGGLPSVVLQQLGAAANGVLATAGFLPATATVGVVQHLRQKLEAAYKKVPLDQFVDTGYAAVKLVARVAEGLKSVTASSLERALRKVTDYNTGLGPVADFTKSSIHGFPRLTSPDDFLWVAKNGNYYLAQKRPINTTPALKLLG